MLLGGPAPRLRAVFQRGGFGTRAVSEILAPLASPLRYPVPFYAALASFLVALGVAGQAGPAGLVDEQMLAALEEQYGPQARARASSLNQLLETLRGSDVPTQLVEINNFFNQFTYGDDIDVWGEEDYWATPFEFLGRSLGDCEDFVISKYFALRILGVEDRHLFLTYVKAVRQNVAHMVLTYHQAAGEVPLVLDNYDPRILPATERPDLVPVYSFNASSLFLSNSSAGLGTALPTDKVKNSKWDALLSTMKAEGP